MSDLRSCLLCDVKPALVSKQISAPESQATGLSSNMLDRLRLLLPDPVGPKWSGTFGIERGVDMALLHWNLVLHPFAIHPKNLM